ncbi:mitochondrial 37S ribosomal protein mS41 ASCRUDRAFT_74734 [Ascoidea rubescens DSM 1968]|uniref:Small ribosomal subunit protein mS41 n=1 Tax=Ascoidea rubescens DSM 1968 TaxID=1344418 RepID=A0A1D2VL46_9ASCO|nr:hypothetical protein ASCRUDRAFT_74734 [Ascoidea rubescens DSM 1968]ODV62328.1 hypothetical protein ASCRUDRAFT_74734 [Ascoidea rubescens DSM 1968]
MNKLRIINQARLFVSTGPALRRLPALDESNPLTAVGRFIYPIPKPTKEIPDVKTFLEKIGRNTVENEEAFESWNEFFRMSAEEMKEKGVETDIRRYIINWRYKFISSKGKVKLANLKLGKKKNGGERNRREHEGRLKNQKRAELRKKYEESMNTSA